MSEKNKTIAEKIADLETAVAWFDSEEFELESALKKFDAARKLADEIDTELSEFKNKINEIKKDFTTE